MSREDVFSQNAVKTFMKKEGKTFTFSFITITSAKPLETGEDFRKIEFQSGGEKLMLESLFINSYSPSQNTGQTNFSTVQVSLKKHIERAIYELILFNPEPVFN